jgi:hypothetical protein
VDNVLHGYRLLIGGTGPDGLAAKDGGIAGSRLASATDEKQHASTGSSTLWYSPVNCILVPLVDVRHGTHDVIGHCGDMIASVILVHTMIHMW